MRGKKQWLLFIFCLLLVFLPLEGLLAEEAFHAADRQAVMAEVEKSRGATGESLTLSVAGAILAEPKTGAVLYEKNADAKQYPASMTKLMTMVIALEEIQAGHFRYDDTVTTSEYAASMGGSQAYLEPGETHSLKELLIAVAVGSANDASVAVAEWIGGSNEGFVAMMNEKAAALGMANTHYVNTHGLHDDNHYTTPRDMMILSLYGLQVPGMLEFTSIKEYEFRPEPKQLLLYTTTKLLFWYEGTDGLKTGTTSQAGRNLAATCEKDGLRLVSVVMGGGTKNSHFSESMKLLNMGFNLYENKTIVAKKELVTLAYVNRGREETVNLLAAEERSMPAPRGEAAKPAIEVVVDDGIFAPIAEGDVLGVAVLRANDVEIDRTELVAANDVAKQTFFQMIGRFIRSVFV